ncbi:MAG: ribulose-phosphate 3-epimerase [Acidobacteriota bacterium]
MSIRLAPSILAADLADLAGAVRLCEQAGADALHVDVMDGHFVPNLTFGLPVVAAIARRTRLPLDVHLMISNPDTWAEAYVDAGAAAVTVHWEVTTHLDRVLREVRRKGARAGVAVNPATPVEFLSDVLDGVDSVLVMSVNPGFSGQSFLPQALEKARRLRGMIAARRASASIAMDGGLGRDTIRRAVEAGVEICVIGSAVFGAADPVTELRVLRQLANQEIA